MMHGISRTLVLLTSAALLGGCVATSKTLTGAESSTPQLAGGEGMDVLQQGWSAGQSGNYMQMLSLCRVAASAPNADPRAFQCIANAQQRLGNMNDAEASYKAYLDRMPNDSNAQLALAKMMMNNGRFQAAQTELEKAVAYNPNSADSQFLLAESYRMQNQCKPAMEHYNHALALNNNYQPAMEGRNLAQQDNCKGMGNLPMNTYTPSIRPMNPTINTRTDGGPPSLSMPGYPNFSPPSSAFNPINPMPGMPGSMSYPGYPQGGGGGYNYNMPAGGAFPAPGTTMQSPYGPW